VSHGHGPSTSRPAQHAGSRAWLGLPPGAVHVVLFSNFSSPEYIMALPRESRSGVMLPRPRPGGLWPYVPWGETVLCSGARRFHTNCNTGRARGCHISCPCTLQGLPWLQPGESPSSLKPARRLATAESAIGHRRGAYTGARLCSATWWAPDPAPQVGRGPGPPS
uniref:Uncharacterized protein n=1 Tax=Terrapene triunguis TaxID=2587831 RepID=A0A674IIL6_9SAUR